MRAVLCSLLVAFAGLSLACGFGGKSKTTEPVGSGPARASKALPEDSLPQSLDLKYNGQNAAYWGEKLLDLNEAVSNNAALALGQLGPESLRFVYKAMSSPSSYVRSRTVMVALLSDEAKKYPAVFRPALAKLLKDERGETRGGAAMQLSAFGTKEDADLVRAAIAAEKDDGTKRTLEFALKRFPAGV